MFETAISLARYAYRIGYSVASAGLIVLANKAHSLALGITVFLCPCGWTIPALLHHIVDIDQLCSEEQMIGITARRVITTMEYFLPFWYGAMQGLPDSAVSRYGLAVDGRLPIALLVASALPFPALIVSAALDVRPQAGQKIGGAKTAAIVIGSETIVHAGDYATSTIRRSPFRCSLSTATLTIAIWHCVRGDSRGIMFHVGNLLNRFSATHLDARNVAGAFSRPDYSTARATRQGA
jgi:hypothetical protein